MSKVTVSHKAILAGLLAILLLAALLRFWNLPGKGIFSYDEGQALAEGQFVASSIKLLPHALSLGGDWASGTLSFRQWADELYRLFHDETRGSLPVVPKLFHTLLVGLAMLISGEKDYAGLYVSAFFGVLTVALVFFLGKRMYNARVGLIAAAVLAGSAYHILYSRMALAETSSGFFFALAIYFYYLSRQEKNRLRLLGLAGFLTGLAYTANYRWVYLPLILWACEAHLWLAGREPVNLKAKLSRLGVVTLGMALPLLAFQAPTLAAGLLSRIGLFQGFSTSYFDLLYQLGFHAVKAGSAQSFHLPDMSYPFLLWQFYGPLAISLTVAGLCLIIFAKVRSSADFIVGVYFLVPLVWQSTIGYPNARHISLILPAAALLAGRAFLWPQVPLLWGRLPRALLPLVVLALIALGGLNSIATVRLTSPYARAVEYIEERGGAHISTSSANSAFYLGWRSGLVKELPASFEELSQLYRQGYRYLLTDYHLSIYEDRYGFASYLRPQILSRITPVLSLDNPAGRSLQVAFESNYSFANTMRYYTNIPNNGAAVISVYDLADYFGG